MNLFYQNQELLNFLNPQVKIKIHLENLMILIIKKNKFKKKEKKINTKTKVVSKFNKLNRILNSFLFKNKK